MILATVWCVCVLGGGQGSRVLTQCILCWRTFSPPENVFGEFACGAMGDVPLSMPAFMQMKSV